MWLSGGARPPLVPWSFPLSLSRNISASCLRHFIVTPWSYMKRNAKCVWGASSIDFLGHCVSARGVQPLPSHVAAVQDFPRPVTVCDLQAFLGIINFYRRFLSEVAKTLKPLTDALCGGLHSTDVVPWTAECAEAFGAAKQALLQAMCLAHLVAGAILSLPVDASATHVGGTLQQQLPGLSVYRPWGFYPRSWSQPSRSIPLSTGNCLWSTRESAISDICWRAAGSPCIRTTSHSPMP